MSDKLHGIPKMGLGTFNRRGPEGIKAIETALMAGFRHLDTAQDYQTERECSLAVSSMGLKREEVFITTKISTDNLGPGRVALEPHGVGHDAAGDAALAQRTAETFGRKLFDMRRDLKRDYPDLNEALDQAQKLEGPVVLADTADNPGGGASSDATFMLAEVLRRGLTNVAMGLFWDPIVVRICREAGEGAELDLRLGGKCSPMSGDPVDIRAKVMAIRDDVQQHFGPTLSPIGNAVWLRSNGVDLIVNDIRTQTFHPEAFTAMGVDLAACHMVVVKSSQHFYAGFSPIASEVIYVATPGSITPDFTIIPYTKRERNYWPVVEDLEL